MKNITKNIKLLIQSQLLYLLLKAFYKTNKWDVRGEENISKTIKNKKNVIVCSWHGRLLVPFIHLSKYKPYGLAGTHNDAEILARVSEKFGWKPLRGSSSERGTDVYNEIINILNNPPVIVALTPDGPKGPEKIPKPGIIRAAQKTNSVIIPVSAFSTKNWTFKNWHKFYLEKPFGKIYLQYGRPIVFHNNDHFENCKEILIKAMEKLNIQNQEYVFKKININSNESLTTDL